MKKTLLFVLLVSQSVLYADLCESYQESYYGSMKKANYYDENQKFNEECKELKLAEYYLMQAYGICKKVPSFEQKTSLIEHLKELIHCK